MVSKTKKFIYIHINKCAGMSVRNWLRGDLEHSINRLGKDHMSLQEVYNNLDINEFNSFYKFAIIRNPYDRLGSIYNYGRKRNHAEHYSKFEESFENFILNLSEHKKRCSSNEELYQNMFSSITEWLSVNGEIKVNIIIPFENLNENLKIIEKKLNLTNKSPLPHLNQGSEYLGGSYKKWYTPEMVRIVNDVYEDDIKNFKFEF